MRKILLLPVQLVIMLALAFTISADEGMYPLSEIGKLNLKAKGLKVDIKEIYNPEGISLVQAICQVGMGAGGGTGEFVSPDGLVLTNHHIAFPAVAAASTPENDYIKNGFTAFTRAREIPAKNYTCQITEDYRDVTAEVMTGISADTPPADRATLIREKMNKIARAEEAGRKNISCQVSEMFPGRSYVLFTYRTIQDVRLVYVPPLGVGNFGGETDNWIWPRHTGDFSFLRAYVAPDGSTAPFADENVPFKPKRYIKVSKNGVRDGDFVFILGFPGRTFRHKTSHFLRLQEEVQLPLMSKRFDWMIAALEREGEGNRALQIKFADEIKSYANVTKNYKGKMQGLRRLQLVADKEMEERELQSFINSDAERKRKYGNLLEEIGKVYENHRSMLPQEYAFLFLGRNRIVGAAFTLLQSARAEERKPEAFERTRQRLAQIYDDVEMNVDMAFLAHSLLEISDLPEEQRFIKSMQAQAGLSVRDREAAVLARLSKEIERSAFSSREGLLALAEMSKEELEKKNDPIIRIAAEFRDASEVIRARQRAREGELNRLEAELLDVKMLWKKQAFIPDANSTLRLTFGYIRGYAPADATKYHPLTTLRGIVEKQTGTEPFDAPQKLIDLYRSRAYDRALEDPALGDVPVAMLYNMDTTGGNSGSPVLNDRGELVGVNFDRAWEATINDYRWSEDYSRSIGVDIRYILFIAKYLGNAEFLLKELGVG